MVKINLRKPITQPSSKRAAPVPTKRLYYFTTKEYALQSLRDKRLKVARFNELNDPFDFVGIALGRSQDRIAIKPIKERLDSELGIICMSTTWQEPLLWGHYAEKHKGICLQFLVTEGHWEDVEYREERPKLTTYRKKQVSDLSQEDIHKLSKTKFKQWEYEREWRKFIHLEDPDLVTGHYFHSFSKDMRLERVILGDRCDVEKRVIHRLCAHNGPSVRLIKAKPANLSFTVLRDKAYDGELPREP
ncbi:Hypothetical protein NGAL_HAMBI490_60450 [Neorhizobium galegae bv. officinalis]|nr:Hypothetical protein NGAL_HAMBI490_60450 [Neorhizobium galegae bv. officinalis]